MSVYIDDILVAGESESEHLETLDEVLRRLKEAGLRLKQKKCAFMLPSVEYLGHQISADGLRPTEEKIRAIAEAPAPRNVAQLRSFLGLVNYYGKFLPQLSTTLAPLYGLLQKHTKWIWGPEQEKSFTEAKAQLTSPCLLVHFDPDKELLLHQYLFGRRFKIYSDHKPLQYLFSESRPVPPMASARIQCWAQTLGAYDYVIAYKAGNQHANADALSRLPLPEAPSQVPLPGETILLMEKLQGSPVTATQVKRWTDCDPVLSQVRHMVLHGCRDTDKAEMQPYSRRKNELSVQDGCVLWGSRVVIPSAGRNRVMDELHEGHPGISRIKGLARSVVWWPGIDADLEKKVKECTSCQDNPKSPAPAPLHPWDWPEHPWARIHIDHAGPFLGKTFLIVVDAHSKWMAVVIVPSTTSQATIKALRTNFATHGLPVILVSDNGTAFTSEEFQEFTKRYGIRHVKSAPYHPASNGLAERAVQTFKEGMKRGTTADLGTRLTRFLFQYQITPHTTTGISPAELLMGQRPRCPLDLMRPQVSSRVRASRERQKLGHAKKREFDLNDPVHVRNFATGPTWLPGVITAIHGTLTFNVKLEDDRVVRRHVDHIRHRTSTTSEFEDVDDCLPNPTSVSEQSPAAPEEPDPQPELRRFARISRPPERYK